MKWKMVMCLFASLAIQASESMFTQDKRQHFGAGVVASAITAHAAKQLGAEHPALWGALGATALGLAKELHDRQEPGNHFCLRDAAATTLGGITVTLVFRW